MKINILAIEKYLPGIAIASEKLDVIAQGKIGRIEKNTGVQYRYHVAKNENVCDMGAKVLKQTLLKANLQAKDLDLLIFAGASFDYPVPHNSVIIKSKITDDKVNFPCLDIDTTCLSFLNALDVAHLYLQSKRYKRIAIVCSEIASKCLTPANEKVFGLFGDAAVSMILESSQTIGYTPIYTHFENYPSGALHAHVPLGGVVNRGHENTALDAGYYFNMDGKNLIRLTTKHINQFVAKMENDIAVKIGNLDKIITHQTSKYGNEFFLRNFNLKSDKVVETLSFYGNCISASIPLGLEHFINNNTALNNKKILLLGTGAGLTLGSMVLEF